MNKKKLEGLLNKRIQLWPVPWELNGDGERVEFHDDLWGVVQIHETGLVLANQRTLVILPLTYDWITNYNMAQRCDGYLYVKGQVYLRGREAWIHPGPYPGPAPARPKTRLRIGARPVADPGLPQHRSWVHGWRGPKPIAWKSKRWR